MTAVNQDFSATAGDAVSPVFTATNSTGGALDLSTVTSLDWALMTRDLAVLLQKSLASDGGIALVEVQPDGTIIPNDGTAGRFQVSVLTGETATMLGRLPHVAWIIDATGEKITLATGVFTVSPP